MAGGCSPDLRSAGQLSPIGGRAALDGEPESLVQTERAIRVLRVDAEHRLLEADLAVLDERRRCDRPGEASPAPRASNADVFEPAALDAEPLVFLRPHPVLDDAGDLVAIPGDDPQARIQLVPTEGRLVRAFAHLTMAPVVAKCLVLRLQDGPPLVFADRTDLDAVGEGSVRDVVEIPAPHQEEMPYRGEPGLRQQGSVADLGILRERGQPDGRERILARRADSRPPQV